MSLFKSVLGGRGPRSVTQAPSPPVCAVRPLVAAHERIYAIGDVHGRADLLVELLKQIKADIRRHADRRRIKIILLGDYIDRGDASAETLGHVMTLANAGAICLLGNHEAALLDFMKNPVAGVNWLEFGGLQTLASYGVPSPDRTDPQSLRLTAEVLADAMGPHLTFLRRGLPLLHHSGNVVFAHAGLEPSCPLDQQPSDAVLWGSRRFMREGWRDDAIVVHGHYATDDVCEGAGRIGIDTGAYYTNRLTALRLDAGEAVLQTGATAGSGGVTDALASVGA